MKVKNKTIKKLEKNTKILLIKKILLKKSDITRERLEILQANLKSYYESIERLRVFSEGQLTLKGKGYTHQVENYKQTQADRDRLPWTLQNLRLQILLAEREIQTLIHYGA